MTTYDLIQHLDSCNLLKPLIQKGIISTTINTKREAYQYYDKEIKIGAKKTDAITHTAEAFNMSEVYVYKIIHMMQDEIKQNSCVLAA